MTPHFGLMDAAQMEPAEAARLRARLHWRGGRRRLRQGKAAAGVAALYDALLCGLRWHLLVNQPVAPERCLGSELENEAYLFAWAEQAGLFAAAGDPARIRTLVEDALAGAIRPADQTWFVAQLEQLLTRIQLLPFAEDSLPPEDPATF